MIGAVDSGGYGMLGLYAAQAPVVPEPPVRPEHAAATANATSNSSGQLPAVPALEPAQAVGSPPLGDAEPAHDTGEEAGGDFGAGGQAQTRQTAVAASLAGAAQSGGSDGATSPETASATGPGQRAARTYARTGQTTGAATPRPGAMFSAQA